MSDTLYNNLINYVKTVVENNNLTNFKSNVTDIFEHVSYELGQQYIDCIKKYSVLSTDQIISYCKKNDMYGGGKKYDYGWITTSPTNFRYLLHSHIILTHIKSQDQHETNIVEIGCGYGGLCLAILELSHFYGVTINEYHLIDLPDINLLQKLYLSNFSFTTKLLFHSAYTYGHNITTTNLFLISNYCFSEIDSEHQKRYISQLFPKVSHGFMTWNHILFYDFGFKVNIEEEYPLTSYNPNNELNNKYISF